MLCCLMDGHARTSTELSIVAGISPSTASAHLQRLKQQHLLELSSQGRHRYYRLGSAQIAAALEALMNVAGMQAAAFVPSTPSRLRAARSCYDHLAGALAVALRERMQSLGWLLEGQAGGGDYLLSEIGQQALGALGIDVEAARQTRRRFACACMDWSERRPHLGGALGAALLQWGLARRCFQRDLDSRALSVTGDGQRALEHHFGLVWPIAGTGRIVARPAM